jgi:Tfp pilus assembly protein PilE
MRYAPRAILAGGLGFAVSCVAACGGGAGLLSGDQSIALSGQGNEISSAVQSGDCGAAVNASAALGKDVQSLPVTVNPTLRSNLTQGAATIARLAAKDCRQHQATTTTPPTTTTATSTPTTTTTTSTSTPTTTSTSSTTSTSTTTTSATTPTNSGTSSETTTSGGVGLGGPSTTTTGNGNSGGTGAGNGNSGGNGGGG